MIGPDVPCFAAVEALVRQRTGLVFTWSRMDAAERGTRRAMEREGHTRPDEYRRALERGTASLDALVAELTVHETYFFRDPAHFALLRGLVLPAIKSATGPDHVVRAWSAGCSSGEEAYSLAIALEEAGLAERSQVLGTDLCRGVLKHAKEGRYRSWALRGVDEPRVQRYFRRAGDEFALERRFQRRVTFDQHNLATASYPSLRSGIWGFDVIFCRNVLVYLERDTVRAIAQRLFESLAVGGFLFLGASDPMLTDEAPFEPIITQSGVLYRRPATADAFLVPLPPLAPPAPLAAWEPPSLEPTPPAPAVALDPLPAGDASAPGAPPPPGPAPGDEMAEARAAFASGDWSHVARATDDAASVELAALGVRAEANLTGAAEAARRCDLCLARYPLSAELHYLHALLLTELGRVADATAAARSVVYLEPSFATGHFVLGSILRRAGDLAGAARAYRNARDLAGARPPDEALPLGDGELAGALAQAAAAELSALAPAALEAR